MRRVDVALLVLDAPCWEDVDADTAARLAAAGIPFAVVVNSRGAADTCDAAWRPDGLAATVPVLWASAREGWGLEGIRAALARLAPAGALKQPPLVHDLLPEHGTLLLVVPLDSGAPQGRLILPQVQTIRDSLDGRCLCLVVTEEQLPQAFAALREPPDLVVCDSQVVHVAARLTPPSVPLTTFSILMARAKGDLVDLARGAAALTRLRPGQTVLVQEACSHHAQKDDIGRVKIPRLLARLAGGPVETPMLAGKEFTEYAGDAAAVVHCGACAITRGQMLARLDEAWDELQEDIQDSIQNLRLYEAAVQLREKAELHRKELLAGQTEFLGEWKERLRDLADRQEVAEDFKERFLERYDALTSRYTEFRDQLGRNARRHLKAYPNLSSHADRIRRLAEKRGKKEKK